MDAASNAQNKRVPLRSGILTPSLGTRSDVRSYVSAQTHNIHEALHHNPVLERLTNPAITGREYIIAMQVLSSFYQAVETERERLDTWDEFTLAGECKALSQDLTGQPKTFVTLLFNDRAALLGGLYVAHGASFGRAQFRKNLCSNLPDVPQSFVNQRTDKNTWRALTDRMEHYSENTHNLASLLNGAKNSFQAVADATAVHATAH